MAPSSANGVPAHAPAARPMLVFITIDALRALHDLLHQS
jgi:hypothetical protein